MNEANQADEKLAIVPADTGVTDHEQFRELVPALLDCSQSVFYIVQDKKFQVVTKQLLTEMGLSQQELLGANPLNIVHPDDRAKVRENAIKMLKGERSEPYEFRTLDKDGNIHFVREAVTSITYRGKPATLGNWIELTEQKRAEEELRRSENSLIEAQRVARIGNWDWEIKRDRLHWSAEMYRIFGFDPRFAANYSTFLDSVHPDDRKFVQQAVYAALFKNQPYNLEYRIVLPDSSERIIYASGQVSFDDETGQPLRMLGTVQDVTERKQAEEELRQNERKYRTLVENLPQKIFLKDKDLVYVSCNENYARDLGIKSDEVAGKTDYDFFPKELAEKYRADDRKILELKKLEDIEENYTLDGREVFVHTVKTPIIGENGESTGVLGVFRDITKHKAQEKQLIESETKYRSIFESANDVIILLDRKGKIQEVNSKIVDVTGFDREDFIGKDFRTLAKILTPRSLAILTYNFAKRIAGVSVPPYEVEMHKKNREIINIEINAVPLKINGEIAGDLAIMRDVTQQKRTLEAVEESEKKFSKAFLSNPNPCFITSLTDGRFIETNDSFSRITGFVKKDITGKTTGEINLWAGEKAGEKIRSALRKHRRVTAEEIIFRTKSGEIRQGIYSAEIIKLSGEDCVLTTINDVTDRKKAEESLRESEKFSSSLMENAPNPIISLNPDTSIRYVNPAFEKLTGYTLTEIAGKKIPHPWWPKDKQKEIKISLNQTLETGPRRLERMFQKKNGEFFWVDMNMVPIVHDGNLKYHMANWNDITERKRMEEEIKVHRDRLEELVRKRTSELSTANQQLEGELAERKMIEKELIKARDDADAANKAKSEFLARMSHEIRTPIHGVMGTLDLLRDTELGQEQRQYVGMARTSAESLLNVINDILDFSKIEAGKIELDTSEFDMRALLEQTLETVAVPAHKKGLEIILQTAHDVPAALVGDAGRLRQVLVNLLGNAVKFTEQGEIVLRVNVEADGEDAAELHFSIRDTGIGIPEDKQQRLFHPFEQADGSMNRKYGGSGLGLSICLQLVNLMGGRIWFTSWPGEGSVFQFTAKFAKQTVGPGVTGTAEIPDSLLGTPVLLIDDNTTCRAMLRDTLNAWGFKVTEADNIRSARQEIEDGKGTSRCFRVILLDKTMPGTNGFAVAEQILDDTTSRSSIVMMLTSDSISDDFSTCQELGIPLYLVKPVKESELLKTMLSVLGCAKTENETSRQAVPKPSGNDAVPLNILVAEDNATSQLIAKKTLEKAGHTVQIAKNGVEAVRMVKEGNHDLVLMDVEMPEMNGLEATQFIRKTEQKSGRHIPIIATTAYAMKEDQQRCLQAGMDAYLSKPVNLEELYCVIKGLSFKKDSEVEAMDVEAALKLVGGDEDILKEVVSVFLEQDCPSQMERLRDGIERNDAQTVKEAAHSIKGAVRSFGGTALGSTALRLEEMGRNSDLTGAQASLQELEQEAKQFADFFNRHILQKA